MAGISELEQVPTLDIGCLASGHIIGDILDFVICVFKLNSKDTLLLGFLENRTDFIYIISKCGVFSVWNSCKVTGTNNCKVITFVRHSSENIP